MFLSNFCDILCSKPKLLYLGLISARKTNFWHYLARTVDRHLQVGAAVEHGSCEHADRNGFPKAAGRGYQDLLRQVVPSIHLQYFLVVLGERSVRLAFPKDPSAGANEIVVEHALVKGPGPSPAVERFQAVPALLHAHETVLLFLRGRFQVVFQRSPPYELAPLLVLTLGQDLVIPFKDVL